MKKVFFIAAMLISMAAVAQQQGACVATREVGTNFAAKEVSFKVTWTGCNDNDRHRHKAWVWVDYREVDPTDGYRGPWTHASIVGAPAVAGDAFYEPGHQQGFYVTPTTPNVTTSATVTVALNVWSRAFDWCAFASDYPPNVTPQSTGAYILQGTPPFAITYTSGGQQHTTSENTHGYVGGCITAITDKTGHPDPILPPFTPGSVLGSSVVCIGDAPGTITTTAPAGGSGVYQFQWQVNGVAIPGATDTTYEIPATDYAVAGGYTYTRLVTDVLCAVTLPSYDQHPLRVDALSVGGALTPASETAYNNQTMPEMTLSGHTGSIVGWQWTWDNANWTEPNNPGAVSLRHGPQCEGTLRNRVVVQNGACPTVTSEEHVTTIIMTLPTPWITTSGSECDGNSVTFYGNGGNGYYQWYRSWSTAWNITGGAIASPNSVGNHYAYIRSYDQTNGVTCYGPQAGPTYGRVYEYPGVSISAPNGTSVVVGTTLSLVGNPGGGWWSTNNGGYATVNGGVVTGVTIGTTSIYYYYSNGVCVGGADQYIDVIAAP